MAAAGRFGCSILRETMLLWREPAVAQESRRLPRHRRGYHHPAMGTGRVNCALAPVRRVSSTNTVPSFGAFNGPTSRPKPEADHRRSRPGRAHRSSGPRAASAAPRQPSGPRSSCRTAGAPGAARRGCRAPARQAARCAPAAVVCRSPSAVRRHARSRSIQDHQAAHAVADQVQRVGAQCGQETRRGHGRWLPVRSHRRIAETCGLRIAKLPRQPAAQQDGSPTVKPQPMHINDDDCSSARIA